MTSFTIIEKWNGKDEHYPAWVMTYDSENNIIRPSIICKCGEHTSIGNHHIHSDGRVTASYYHKNGCGWHVYLFLRHWIEKEFLPGQEKPKI